MTAAMRIEAEDQGRAFCYALIGRLMYGVVDAALLSYIAGQPAADDASALGPAWKALQSACGDAKIEQLRQEYDDLFVGVGKAPVTLYTSAYAAPRGADRHLLALRDRLDNLGLARRTDAGETEDHISALCDVMRWLIENARGAGVEQRFFGDFVAPVVGPLRSAIAADPRAAFYGVVASYMESFLEIERAGFELAKMEGG